MNNAKLRILIVNRRPADNIFFFQAEDGIRDLTVTGVQTCALPICEEVRDADNDNKLKRRSAFHLTTNRHELTRIGRARHSMCAAASKTKPFQTIFYSDSSLW